MSGLAHRPAVSSDVSTGDRGSQQGPAADTSREVGGSGNTTGVDPSARTDASGNPTTTQGAATVGEATNHQAVDPPEFAFTDGQVIETRTTALAPYVVNGPAPPPDGAVYRVVNGGQCRPGQPDPGVLVDAFDGTLAAPNVTEVPDERTIYVGGAPSPDDIQQGTFADCYFLASVASVVAQDPGYISGTLISDKGTSVDVNLFRWDNATSAWVATTINVTKDLVRERESDGSAGALVGAGYRVGATPTQVDWWATTQGSMLSVHARRKMELALWAPLLEKAYARYSERWGQYGGVSAAPGVSLNEKGGGTGSGYDAIQGGLAQVSYRVLYGPNAQINETTIAYTPGADLVQTNQNAIANLIRVAGDPTMPANRNFVMTSGLSRDEAVTRLGQQVTAILGGRTIGRYRTLKTHLEKLSDKITRLQGATVQDDIDRYTNQVVAQCANLATAGNWPLLHSPTAPQEYKDFNEQCNIVMNLTTDASGGQRFIYAWHSYSVLGAEFKDTSDAALAVTLTNLPTTLASIDGDKSTVRMRNPHGQNSPNEHGDADQSADDGNFTLSLNQYLRNFGFQQHGMVPS